MSANISDELRREIAREKGAPVYLVDAEAGEQYVVISAQAYDRIRALFGDSDPFDISETYAVQDRAAEQAWSHPDDAAYDDYDAHRGKP
jgi:hypothetical protein